MNNPIWIIGVNAYHGDASACLLRDGELIAAAEEERFRRIKHWAGFPSESIKYCLLEGGVSLNNIHTIAINSDPRANFLKKFFYVLKNKPSLDILIDRIRNQTARLSIENDLEKTFPNHKFKGKIRRIEHHLCHLASSYLASDFQKALVISIDGFGDFASCTWGIGENNCIKILGKIYYPHSLGSFYQSITQFLGFPHFGDEYKVMGLAPYGKPRFMDQMREIVKLNKNGSFYLNMHYFRYHRENIGYTWKDGSPSVQTLYGSELNKLLGDPRQSSDPLEERHWDIARSAQEMYEHSFFHLLNNLYDRYSIANIALSGGCAMNSVANGKIVQQTSFKNIYLPSAAGDAGGAIDAALSAWHEFPFEKKEKRFLINHAYWGPQFNNVEIKDLLSRNCEAITNEQCCIELLEDENILCERTASAIAEGKVIGWFQGRMEWGPRALGNRSILCDPRRTDMKDILNLKIKRRESFRPFAPSILRQSVKDWFEIEDDVPYMMQVFKIRAEKRTLIPAVTHVDGTGRLQTVHQETNSLYYKLITCFAQKTDVPLVLNTSFNENEPVVCKPEEALNCFLRTKMDVLVLNNYYIYRK